MVNRNIFSEELMRRPLSFVTISDWKINFESPHFAFQSRRDQAWTNEKTNEPLLFMCPFFHVTIILTVEKAN